jgi:hypothetical protein
VRVILTNPRWEKRLLRFLELSGVERVGTYKDEAWARRMDDWIVWEAREEVMTLGAADLPFSVSFSFFPLCTTCKGDSCPEDMRTAQR